MSETFNGLANSDLPIMSETFKKSMPDSICRIGIRQPIFFCRIGIRQPRHFHYRLLFGNKIHRERWVDQEVSIAEERRPRRSLETRVFRYRLHLGKEINRKRWVDQEVNLPEERRPRRS